MLSIEEATSFLKSHLPLYLYLSVRSFLKSSSILRIIHLRYISHVYFHTFSFFIIIVSHDSILLSIYLWACIIFAPDFNCTHHQANRVTQGLIFISFQPFQRIFLRPRSVDKVCLFFFLNQTHLPWDSIIIRYPREFSWVCRSMIDRWKFADRTAKLYGTSKKI